MKIILTAMPSEAEFLINKLSLNKKNYFYENNEYRLFIIGIGVANVIENMSKIIKNNDIKINDKIINIGYAGSKGIKVGEIVSISDCQRFNPSHTIEEKKVNLIPIKNFKITSCLTNDDFVEEDDEHNNIAYDMELFYIAKFFENPISSLKIISDNLDYKSYENFQATECWNNIIEYLNSIH